MGKISAVIISFNEEKKIASCLASLQGVADEIIVLDSFSTDKTPDICKQFGVKFFQQNWRGYGNQKNDAAAKATYDYVLSLDADECLSETLQQSILREKKAGLSGAYKMNRLNIFFGYALKHGLSYPDHILRLYNKTAIKWAPREVHETLDVPQNISITWLTGDLLHKSKDTLDDFISTINKYSALSAAAYFAAGKRASVFKILFNPFASFIKGFFFRLGFLDGIPGFIIAIAFSLETFLKYSKLYLLQKKQNN